MSQRVDQPVLEYRAQPRPRQPRPTVDLAVIDAVTLLLALVATPLSWPGIPLGRLVPPILALGCFVLSAPLGLFCVLAAVRMIGASGRRSILGWMTLGVGLFALAQPVFVIGVAL